MTELLSYIVTSIVRHPEDVKVSQVENEDGTHITLRLAVHPDDMGLIIGRQGSIARALRNIVKAKALQHGSKVYIDILEANGDQSAASDDNQEVLTDVS